MKAIVCIEPGVLEYKQFEKPTPKAGEVLVKIKSIGICGTDIHAFGGNQPFFEYPRVLGHELSGVVADVGEGVSLDKDKPVYIIPYMSCGTCIACRSDKPNCCTNIEVLGVHRDGGMCEYLCVPEKYVVSTEGLSFNDLAVVECFSIGAHAVKRAQITEKDTVLILGAGPIGIGALQFSQVAGAKVLVSDVDSERLAFCQREYCVDGAVDATGDVTAQLSQLTDGDFPTVILDCTGNVSAMESAITHLAHGGRIVYVSVVKSNITFSDPEFHKRETTLMGSRNATHDDFAYVVSCLKEGKVKSGSFITHSTKFSDMIESFTAWVKPGTGIIKAVIEMDG